MERIFSVKWWKKHWDEVILIIIILLAGYYFLKGTGTIWNMKKITFILTVIVWVFGITIVVFNNLYQIWTPLLKNPEIRMSFILVLIRVTIYSIINKDKLEKELK